MYYSGTVGACTRATTNGQKGSRQTNPGQLDMTVDIDKIAAPNFWPGVYTNAHKQHLHLKKSQQFHQSHFIVGWAQACTRKFWWVTCARQNSGPIRGRDGAACLGRLTNRICLREGPISTSSSLWHGIAISQSEAEVGGDQSSRLQSATVGAVYVGKARLLAGLRTSHIQLYVS